MRLKPKELLVGVREFWMRCPDVHPTSSEILQNSLRVGEKLQAKGGQQLPRLGLRAGTAVGAEGTGVVWRSSRDETSAQELQDQSCAFRPGPMNPFHG